MNPTGAMSTSTLIAAYRRRILYNGLIGVRSEEVRLAAAQAQADQERRRAEGLERSAEGLRMGRKERRRVADKKRAVQAMDALDKVNGWKEKKRERRGGERGMLLCALWFMCTREVGCTTRMLTQRRFFSPLLFFPPASPFSPS